MFGEKMRQVESRGSSRIKIDDLVDCEIHHRFLFFWMVEAKNVDFRMQIRFNYFVRTEISNPVLQ